MKFTKYHFVALILSTQIANLYGFNSEEESSDTIKRFESINEEREYIEGCVLGKYLSLGGLDYDREFSDIYAGNPPEEINDFLLLLKDRQNDFRHFVQDIKFTLLLYGPPGTGKTTLAKAMAADARYPLFKLIPTDIPGKYFTEKERHLKNIFTIVYEYAVMTDKRVILFIDEIDSLLAESGMKGSNTEDMNNKVNSVFLNYFGDRDEKDEDHDFLERVVLIGATNRRDLIPKNSLSRFFKQVEINNPDGEQRASVLWHLLSKIPSNKISIDQVRPIAKVDLEGFTSREIKNCIQEAGMIAYREYLESSHDENVERCFTLKHLKEAIERYEQDENSDMPHLSYFS